MSQSPPGTVLLTGASGFVGSAVLQQLLITGYRVHALERRPGSIPAAEGVSVYAGDVTDPASLLRAAQGCQFAIHCAADYRLSLRPGEVSQMISVNVGGTANVLQAAAAAGIRRLVHCSTVGTLAFERSGKVCVEADTSSSPALLAGPYKRSKWAAERLALEHTHSGLGVVVVQPSTPVGKGDRRPTPTGQTISDFLRGRIPAVVDTGLNLVSVDAVARGHVLALERGLPGRSYILGDQNLTLRQLLARVAHLAGTDPPRWRVPLSLAFATALTSEGVARFVGRAPAISLTSVRMAAHPMYVDSQRAQSELGWETGELDLALRQAVEELRPKSGRRLLARPS
ncbi:MAG: NAD-dependent epimerase/dehydratase family protein [Candidatus Dormiibacterota bacterium]